MNKKLLLSLFIFLLVPIVVNAVNLCPCSFYTYDLQLDNPDNSFKEYSISVSKYADFVVLSEKDIVLAPGEQATVYAFIEFPCDYLGHYSFDFILTNKVTNAQIKVPFELDILPCSMFDLESGKSVEPLNTSFTFEPYSGTYDLCAGIQSLIPVKLDNNFKFNDEFSFGLEEKGPFSLYGDSLTLKSGQEGISFIVVNPDFDESGNYAFLLKAESSMTKAELQLPIKANIMDCFALDLDLKTLEDSICTEEENTYSLEIINNGIFDEAVNIDYNGIYTAQSTISVKAKSSKMINFSFVVPQDNSGNFEETVSVSLASLPTVSTSDTIQLKVTPRAKCYQAKISASSISADYDGKISTFKVKNTGIRQADYTVKLDAPDWVDITPKQVSINPGKEAIITLDIDTDDDVEAGKYPVKISLIKDNSLAYEKDINISLKKTLLLPMMARFFMQYIYWIIIGIILLVILILILRAIIKGSKARKEKRKLKREQKRMQKEKEKLEKEKAKEEKKELKSKESKKKQEKPETKKIAAKAEKKTEKNPNKKAKKQKSPFNWKGFLISLIGAIILTIIVLAIIFRTISLKILAAIRDFFIVYLYYIILGFIVLAVILFFMNMFSKKK